MALLDAFLLDPAPFNVWISYRTDNQKGSGTASDPWNGSPRLNAPINITLSPTGSVAMVNLPSGHGLANGDVVVIAGATQEPTVWNGTFTIWGIVGNVGYYTMRSTPGSGSPVGTITLGVAICVHDRCLPCALHCMARSRRQGCVPAAGGLKVRDVWPAARTSTLTALPPPWECA